MDGYKGEKEVALKDSEYKNFTPSDWAKLWIEMNSQFDGSHHKANCLDEVQRVLFGTKVVLKIASWENGHTEERISLAEPSDEYIAFVKEYENDGEYSWDIGIPA